MRWHPRQQRDERRPATSTDPVGNALTDAAAGGALRQRHRRAGAPTLEQLPAWIEVCDSDDVDGFNTVVFLDDEIHAYCDPYDDGLDQALADQRGVDKLLAEDREVIYLRTRLALADVKAAVVRAVVEVNRRPREPLPTGALSEQTVESWRPRCSRFSRRPAFRTRAPGAGTSTAKAATGSCSRSGLRQHQAPPGTAPVTQASSG